MKSVVEAKAMYVAVPASMTKDQYEKLKKFMTDLFKDIPISMPPVTAIVLVNEPTDEKKAE